MFSTMKSIESLNFSRSSFNHSRSKSRADSTLSSPGVKSKKSIIEDSDHITNNNKIKLRKADSFNNSSIAKSWVDLNLMKEPYSNKDKVHENIDTYNTY